VTIDGDQVSLGSLSLLVAVLAWHDGRATSDNDGHRQERIAEWNTAAAEWTGAQSISPFGGMQLVAQCSTGLALQYNYCIGGMVTVLCFLA
jgi:hypothetical protein